MLLSRMEIHNDIISGKWWIYRYILHTNMDILWCNVFRMAWAILMMGTTSYTTRLKRYRCPIFK